jgi:GNAT superfamily N-acetyltransferase
VLPLSIATNEPVLFTFGARPQTVSTRVHEIVFREAHVGDAPELTRLFRETYDYSSHPCLDEGFVRRSIQQQHNVWRLACCGGRIVGCVAGHGREWNQSWEIGCGVVAPEFRREGLSRRLVSQCARAAWDSRKCDLVYGFPRNAAMARIVTELNPAMHITGHDAGRNVSNGIREYHAFACGFHPARGFRHVVPRTPSSASSRVARMEVFAPLGLSTAAGDYPADWLAGDAASARRVGDFCIHYDARCPSGSMEVAGYLGQARHGCEVADGIARLVAAFGVVPYVCMAVPVDKSGLIAALFEQGFDVTAYLPAWLLRGDERFDCLMMVRTQFGIEPADHGLGSHVQLAQLLATAARNGGLQ